MGRAVLTGGNAGVAACDFDVQLRIGNGVADLLKRSAGGEHGKRSRYGNLTGCRHACRNADHVALGNAAVKETLGKLLLKYACFGRGGEVRVKYNDIGIGLGKLAKRLAKALSCRFHYCLSH